MEWGFFFKVFTRECMSHYLRVFNFLWRAKRMEYTLTDIWKGQMCNAKLLKTMPGTLFLDKCQNLQEHDAKVFIIDTPDIAVFHVNIGLWCLHRNATNHPLTNVTFPSPPPQNCRVCCTSVTSWRLRWSTSSTRCSTTSPLRSG